MSPELAVTLAVAEVVLDASERCLQREDTVGAMLSTGLAARTLARQGRILAHPRVEANIRRLATTVRETSCQEFVGRRGCLHVLTQALPAGGHTAMAIRWISSESSGVPHHVALLSQRTEVPSRLRDAVVASGGQVFRAPDLKVSLENAAWLRSLARRVAERVVLHIDVDDVTAAIAFGTPGGPPVMIVNHAAHIFWVGVSVADLVIDCRGSALEDHWTRRYRGATSRAATIPIPLNPAVRDETSCDERRARARHQLGISQDALVLLTVGDTYKYAPFPHANLDFVTVARTLLERAPQAILLVVGVVPDDRWAAVSDATEGRLRVMGRQADLGPFHDAADVYIEGFPFGSTTALLEAGLSSLPAVLAPAVSPPPFGTDGIAVDSVLSRPQTVDDYVGNVLQLLADPMARCVLGRRLADEIRHHHVGAGWNRHLTSAVARLPSAHQVYDSGEPVPTPAVVHEYWTAFRETCWTGISTDVPTHELQQDCLVALVSWGARPVASAALWRVSLPLRGKRRGSVVPSTLLLLLTVVLVVAGPRRSTRALVAAVTTLFRPGSRTSRVSSNLLPGWLW
jgi:hypothetical protein